MKKISKKKAMEFCKALCGTSKGLRQEPFCNVWIISLGHMRYDFWPLKEKIYCQLFVGCECIGSYFFDCDTYEPDVVFTDEDSEKSIWEKERSDRYDFLLWLMECKYKIHIPDELLDKYKN